MTRTTTPLLFTGLLLLPLGAGALGMGPIQVRSALNQPLQAEIELLAAQPDELENLSIGLAPLRTFVQAGVERTPLLSDIQFGLVSEGGRDLVRVTTERPVREPFLNFLVEMSNNQGRVVREFTVLLDPPDYSRPAPAPTPAPGPNTPVQPPAPPVRSAPAEVPDRPLVVGEQVYGPVSRGESLWRIADRLRPPSVSIQEMMQALYAANPQAFGGNPDNLRAGARLRVPALAGVPVSVAPAPPVPAPTAPPPAPTTPAVAQAQVPQPDDETADEPREPVIGDPASRPRVRLVPPRNPEADRAAAPAGEAGNDAPGAGAPGGGGVEGQGGAGGGPATAPGGIAALAPPLRIPAEGDRLTGLRLSSLEDLRAQLDDLSRGGPRPQADPVRSAQTPPTTALAPTPSPLPDTTLAPAPDAAPSPTADRPAPVVASPPQQPGLIASLLRGLDGLLLPLAGLALVLVLLLGLFLVRRRRAVAERPGVEEMPQEEQGFTVLDSTAPPPPAGEVVDSTAPPPASAASVPAYTRPQEPADVTETPLERADLLIAVGNYREAESLVRSAMDRQPDNTALSAKLLDIHYAAGDAEAFREAAVKLQQQLGDDDDPLWLHAEAMGQDLLPGDPLFSTAASASGEAAAAPSAEEDRWILDWEPERPVAPAPLPSTGMTLEKPAPREETPPSLSKDETFTRLEPEEDLSLPGPADEDEDFFKEVFEDPEWQEKPAAPAPPPAEESLPDLEFDLESLPDPTEPRAPVAPGVPDEPNKPVVPAPEDNPFAADDYVETKLDLAVAYLDMEDPVGARSLLEEVVQEGSDHQRNRARELMAQLSG